MLRETWPSLQRHHTLITHAADQIALSSFTNPRKGELQRELLTFNFHLMNRGNLVVS